LKRQRKHTILAALEYPLIILALMWLVFLIDYLFPIQLAQYGILPRNKSGLIGILFSPLLHSTRDFTHIINNSPPFLILGWTLFYFYRKIAWQILSLSWLVGGLFVWLAARSNYHIGMSGVIYSLAFFLFFSGVFRKELKLMAISLFVVFLYGSMVWGIFPGDPGISFEGHLFGAIVGVILAYYYKKEGATLKKKVYDWEREEALDKEMEAKGYKKVVDPESGFTVHYEYQENSEK
jgi:membrane associated rhomboid family serine protease